VRHRVRYGRVCSTGWERQRDQDVRLGVDEVAAAVKSTDSDLLHLVFSKSDITSGD